MMVSVIIPNYNHAEFLGYRIDSILNQSYQDFELIILDDCSTDNSRKVLEGYRNSPKISQIIYNETNSGSTFKQWDKGIALAKGDWIWIAESDDWCEANFLETIMSGLSANPDCVLGYCQSYCVVNDNEIRFQSHHSKLLEYCDGVSFIKNYMLNGNAIFNASMAVWKKEKYKTLSQAFTGYRFCGDWLFWIELASQGEVMISGRLLNYFRKHDRDVSGTAYKTGLSILEEVKMVQYLFQNRFITLSEHNTCMAKRYSQFEEQKKGLDPVVADEVRSLFLDNKDVHAILQQKRSSSSFKNYLRKIVGS